MPLFLSLSLRQPTIEAADDNDVQSKHLLFIYMNKLHVHRVNRGENIRRSLYDTLARLRHGDGRAGS
jgi:hypothetical protein